MEFLSVGNDFCCAGDGYGDVVSLGGCLGWDGETKAKVISEVEFGRRLEDFSFFRLAVV